MSGALPLPAARPWGGRPAPSCLFIPGAGGAGAVTHHRPHSVRSSGPASRAAGVAGGRPREERPAPS